jgi:GTP-binding protein
MQTRFCKYAPERGLQAASTTEQPEMKRRPTSSRRLKRRKRRAPQAALENRCFRAADLCDTPATVFIVHISSAIFHCSAPDLSACPDESLPEFAFIGRSNVGKSSLLNMLAGEQGLARVSPRPGFTKMINIFKMNKTWRLVDLPGYGFATGAKKDSQRFNKAVAQYLKHRPNLCLVFALIESGLEPQDIDIEFIEWLARNEVPFVLVFTKTDKVPPATVQANIAAFMERIAAWFVQPPTHFTCSAEIGQGRQDLLGVIEEMMTAIKIQAKEAENSPDNSQPKLPPTRKRGPDLNRPW